MEIVFIILLFLLGLFLVSKGGDYFLDASIWIAETFNIPKIIVGATIVTIGTTLPEMIVSISASIQGNAGLASSNAVGSITVNVGLIVSLVLIFLPAEIRRSDYIRKILLLFITIFALLYFIWDGFLGAVECLILLSLFAVFLFVNIREARSCNSNSSSNKPSDIAAHKDARSGCKNCSGNDLHPKKQTSHNDKSRRSVFINITKLLLGAAGIYFGSQLLINNGVLLAEYLGISEVVIGFTAVGIGTSLPELITAIKCLKRSKTSVSIGNVIGANIVGTTLILPLSSLFSGNNLFVPETIVRQDIPVYILLIGIIFIPALLKKRFARWQGIFAFSIYIIYVVQMFFV